MCLVRSSHDDLISTLCGVCVYLPGVYLQMFFPMLDRLLEEIETRDKLSLEETRVRACNLLCKVCSHDSHTHHMCVCTHAYTHTCIHTHMCTCTHMHTLTYTCIHTRTLTTCIYAQTHIHTYTPHVYMYMYSCCISLCICTH